MNQDDLGAAANPSPHVKQEVVSPPDRKRTRQRVAPPMQYAPPPMAQQQVGQVEDSDNEGEMEDEEIIVEPPTDYLNYLEGSDYEEQYEEAYNNPDEARSHFKFAGLSPAIHQ